MSDEYLAELRESVSFYIDEGRSLYFHTETPPQNNALAGGLATLLPAPVHIYRFSGDYFTFDEASQIQSALRSGNTVMLIVNGPHPPAIRLLKMWADAHRGHITPKGTRERLGSYWGIAGRHLTISDGSENSGVLVLLQLGGERQALPGRHFFKPDEAQRLEQVGFSIADPAVRDVGVHSRADEASRLTFKDLCLLHLRDRPASNQTVPDLLLAARRTPVSWLDLREIIRTKGHRVDRELRKLKEKGLLDDEQWNVFELANDFLDLKAESQTRMDVYEAVWRHERLESDGFFFRGQRRSTWRLDTTLFRPSPDGPTLDVGTLVERAQRTSLFVTALRERELEFFQGHPSDEELLAVAQHYGFATPLLDFSRSLRVAAFFATHGEAPLPSDEKASGIIYYLKPDNRRSQQLLDRTESIGLHGFDLLREAGLRFGQWKVLEPALAEAENRIARQRGAFLEGADVRHLSGVMLDRIEFEHQPGTVFEDPHAGVTRELLLPDESTLAELADELNRRFDAGDRTPIHPVMKGVSLSTPSIIGVQHAWLDVQVEEAVDFFSGLRKVGEQGVGDSLIKELVGSIREYFVEVRLLADLGALPATAKKGDSHSSPLERAVTRMCEVTGTDCDQVLKNVRELVPDWDDGTWRAPDLDGERRLDHWLVLACAVYLIGWDHLTSVQGARSRGFSMKAREIIHLVESRLKAET